MIDQIDTALETALGETLHEMRATQAKLNELTDEIERLQAAQVQRHTLMAHIKQLDVEYRGLESALNRRRHGVPLDAPLDETSDDWLQMTRPEAVLRVLGESSEPLGPGRITDILHEHGRDDPRKGVSVALMRLKKRGRVRSLERGAWALGMGPEIVAAAPVGHGGSGQYPETWG
jgi:hypothetical protein